MQKHAIKKMVEGLKAFYQLVSDQITWIFNTIKSAVTHRVARDFFYFATPLPLLVKSFTSSFFGGSPLSRLRERVWVRALHGLLIGLLATPVPSFAADAEIKLNSQDGSTELIIQDNQAIPATVFSVDSDGNMVAEGSVTIKGAGGVAVNTINSASGASSISFSTSVMLASMGGDPIGTAGRLYFHGPSNRPRLYNGIEWVDIATGVVGGATDIVCVNCVALGPETAGIYIASATSGGAGIQVTFSGAEGSTLTITNTGDTNALDDIANPSTAKINLNAPGADLGTTSGAGIEIDTNVFVTGGKVGVGTTAPTARLHAIENSDTPALQLEGNGVETNLTLKNTTPAGRSWTLSSGGTGSGYEGQFLIFDDTSFSQRLIIDSAGNAGIGAFSDTTPPRARLHVSSTAADGQALLISKGPNAGIDDLMIVRTTGNVGIGTITPGHKLEVAGGIKASTITLAGISQPTAAAGMMYYDSGSSKLRISNGSTWVDIATGTAGLATDVNCGDCVNGLDLADTITLDSDLNITGGNVGISTGNPRGPLHVAGTNDHLVIENSIVTTPVDEKIWVLKSNSGSGDLELLNMTDAYGFGSVSMAIGRNGVNVASVTFPNGNVGIGTTSPGAKLDVQAGVAGGDVTARVINSNAGPGSYAQVQAHNDAGRVATMGIFSSGSTGTGAIAPNVAGFGSASGAAGTALYASDAGGYVALFTGGATSSNERLRINSSGNVGIGTTSPQSKFEVNGSMALKTVTTNTAHTLGDETVVIVTAAVTVTVPAASASNMGRIYYIRNAAGAGVTITPTTDGLASLPAGEAIQIVSNGSSWYIIARKV